MTVGYCAYTGRPIETTSDGIYDDGEWISWEYISQHQDAPIPAEARSAASSELREIFDSLVHTAAAYKKHTGRYLDIFGELGEVYAEIHIGLKRHKPNTAGSDGRLGNDFVEVKTISPLKQDDKVRVKQKGNFNKLYVVRVSENFHFEAGMIDRRNLKKGGGKFTSVRFGDLQGDDSEKHGQ